MEVEIVKIDNEGKGIGYVNNKIIFVPKTTVGDIVNIEIVKDNKKYQEGKIINFIKKSNKRIKPVCPYYDICGGCDLMHLGVSDSLEYKLETINNLLQKNNIDYNVEKIIKSEKQYNYRNKVSLKIVDDLIGYYEINSHKLVNIDYCYLCNEEINNFIKDINSLNIHNGMITIRCNNKQELSISIETLDKLENIEILFDKYKIVEYIVNNKKIINDKLLMNVNNYLFEVSNNSFFQVNDNICSKLFDLINMNTKGINKVLDLYCGVGTLSIVSFENVNKVLGVEIVSDAIENAKFNAKLNRCDNIEFICNDTKNIINLIDNRYDLVILDPPRSGVNEKVIEKILESKIKKIIYVSCNPITLVRDLKLLTKYYDIENLELLDMFPNTHHIESFCVLKMN